jgi:hypothetical protein
MLTFVDKIFIDVVPFINSEPVPRADVDIEDIPLDEQVAKKSFVT